MATDTTPQALHAIAGRWTTSGHVIGEPPVSVAGTDTYEVLDGGHFLVHHVDVTVGDQPVRAIEIIGEPDSATGGYLARSFDNNGGAEVMLLTIDDNGVFHFNGGAEVATAAQPGDRPTTRVRSTLMVADDRQSMTALWERADEHGNWLPWMHINFHAART